MTLDDIIRMAREAGLFEDDAFYYAEQLTRFAALVAAHEREACAKLCDEMPLMVFPARPSDCAAAIRSRT